MQSEFYCETHNWSEPRLYPSARCIVRFVRACTNCGAIQDTSTASPGWNLLDHMDLETIGPSFCRPHPVQYDADGRAL